MIWFFLAVVLTLLVYAPGFRRVVARLAIIAAVLAAVLAALAYWQPFSSSTSASAPSASAAVGPWTQFQPSSDLPPLPPGYKLDKPVQP